MGASLVVIRGGRFRPCGEWCVGLGAVVVVGSGLSLGGPWLLRFQDTTARQLVVDPTSQIPTLTHGVGGLSSWTLTIVVRGCYRVEACVAVVPIKLHVGVIIDVTPLVVCSGHDWFHDRRP